MEEKSFYKTGKIDDYLLMKTKGIERKSGIGADKIEGNCDKTGQLRRL